MNDHAVHSIIVQNHLGIKCVPVILLTLWVLWGNENSGFVNINLPPAMLKHCARAPKTTTEVHLNWPKLLRMTNPGLPHVKISCLFCSTRWKQKNEALQDSEKIKPQVWPSCILEVIQEGLLSDVLLVERRTNVGRSVLDLAKCN